MSSKPVIVAKFSGYSVFKIPEKYQDLPISHFDVLWDTLYVYDGPKDKNPKILCEIKSSCSAEDTMDWKRPDGELVFDEQKSWPVDDESESESESEQDEPELKKEEISSYPTDSFNPALNILVGEVVEYGMTLREAISDLIFCDDCLIWKKDEAEWRKRNGNEYDRQDATLYQLLNHDSLAYAPDDWYKWMHSQIALKK